MFGVLLSGVYFEQYTQCVSTDSYVDSLSTENVIHTWAGRAVEDEAGCMKLLHSRNRWHGRFLRNFTSFDGLSQALQHTLTWYTLV